MAHQRQSSSQGQRFQRPAGVKSPYGAGAGLRLRARWCSWSIISVFGTGDSGSNPERATTSWNGALTRAAESLKESRTRPRDVPPVPPTPRRVLPSSLLITLLLLTVGWSPLLNLLEDGDEGDAAVISQEGVITDDIPISAPVISPPAQVWWDRGDAPASIYVLTRDLAALHAWQEQADLLPVQAPAGSGEQLVNRDATSGVLEHRRIDMPANLVPKLLGVHGVTVVFEDPGPPERATEGAGGSPSSVKSGQIHGATQAWDGGVNGSGVKVAIVDSGIDFAHPDLNGTQARVDDPSSPWDGWPIMWDPRSADLWLRDAAAYPENGGSWYANTSTLDNDSNNDSVLDVSGINISGIPPSLSGVWHLGQHPDSRLVSTMGGDVTVVVVDDQTAGVYETVYVDINRDGNLSDEKPMRKGDETAGLDLDNDSLWDRSAGLIYWISDGNNSVPYAPTYSARAGFTDRIAGAGNLTLFMINDRNDPGGNHGTLCASAVAAQGVVSNGKVLGMAPGAELIAVADVYAGGSFLDSWRFVAEGYDGFTSTGDEAQIGSFSFGWSNIHNDGTDYMSLYVDWLTRVHSPETLYSVALGNGGHGYGTVVSPGGAHGVLSVGAFSSLVGEPHGGTWGDTAAWSNRGPNSVGRLDPDIVAVGWSATGDRTLNEVGNANSATATWAGTSLATPVAAGLTALIYDAWFQRWGVYPDSQTVRDVIMSTAQDRGYDPLVQGAGWFDAAQAVSSINGSNDTLLVSPAYWMPGYNHGQHREANLNILMPGEVATANFTFNGTGASNLTVVWQPSTLQPLQHWNSTWVVNASDGWDGYQGGRPDIFIPIHIEGDANLSIPNGTSLIRARAAMNGEGFDNDQNRQSENRVYVELFSWHDVDGDGIWWNDTDGDGYVDGDEMEGGNEYSTLSAHTYQTGQSETRAGWPLERGGDGIILGVYRHEAQVGTKEPLPIDVDWTAFGPDVNNTWLSPCSNSVQLSPNGSGWFNCSVNVPADALPGIHQEQIRISTYTANGTHLRDWPLPVVVNVASPGPLDLRPKPIDGNVSNQTLYTETWLQGAQRWGWRSESGDWKFLSFDWPQNMSGDGAIVIDVDWPNNSYTDVDVHWMSERGHPFQLDDPAAYGPVNLEPEVSSRNMDVGSGIYDWETSTGSSHEVLVAEATPGLKQMMLHSAMHGVNTNDNPLNISVGYVASIDGTLSRVVRDWNDATGQEVVTFGSTMGLDIASVTGYGWTQPTLLPTETALQDTPGGWSSSSYRHQFTVDDAVMLRIEIDSSAPRTDLDLALYHDKNGDGNINWGGEQIDVSGNWNSDEEITIENPDDGTWWAVVNGFDVPNGSANFMLKRTIVSGDLLTVTNLTELNSTTIQSRFPNGSSVLAGRMPVTAFDVVVDYGMPAEPGDWRGWIVLELASGGKVRLEYDYQLLDYPPELVFSTPLNGTRTNATLPVNLATSDIGDGFNLSSLSLEGDPSMLWDNLTISVEGIESYTSDSRDFTASWKHWNSGASLANGTHYSETSGKLVIEAESYTDSALGDPSNHTWEVNSSVPGYSGTGHLNATPDDGANINIGSRLDYSIDFNSPGQYYVWLRLSAPDANGDSIRYGIDGQQLGLVEATSVDGQWDWAASGWANNQSQVATFMVQAAGRHVFSLWMLEDGLSVDRIIIIDDWLYTPLGKNETTSTLYEEALMRAAWVNLTLPTDEGWRTFWANVSDNFGKLNQTILMVEYDTVAPPIILYGWTLLTNVSNPDWLWVQSDVGSRIWVDGIEHSVDSSGRANLSLSLNPSEWSNVAGDSADVTTWEWVGLNTFRVDALDLAGNWNQLEFDIVYDEIGPTNDLPPQVDKQVKFVQTTGDSPNGSWAWPPFDGIDSDFNGALNARTGPMLLHLESIFDTRRMCIRLLDESGFSYYRDCEHQQTPPWGDDNGAHLRGGETTSAREQDPWAHVTFEFEVNQSQLLDGEYQVEVELLDFAENWGHENFTLELDRTSPEVGWITPANNVTLLHHEFVVEWNISEPARVQVLIDGLAATTVTSQHTITSSTSLALESVGEHEICIYAVDLSFGPDPNTVLECITVLLPPEIYFPTLTAEWNGSVVNTPTLHADLYLGPDQSWSWSRLVNSTWIPMSSGSTDAGDISVPVQLLEGENHIRFDMSALEHMFVFLLEVHLDTQPPQLTIDSPPRGLHTSNWSMEVTGGCQPGLEVDVRIADESASASCTDVGTYTVRIDLPGVDGLWLLNVSSTDIAGNLGWRAQNLTIDRRAPQARLEWDLNRCDPEPVPSVFRPEPMADCELILRVDFLDDDIVDWSLLIEREREIEHSMTGGSPGEQTLWFDISEIARPGHWDASLRVSDLAGNNQIIELEAVAIAPENTMTAKVSEPGSLANMASIAGLLLLLVFWQRRQRSGPDTHPIGTPLDPELFLDDYEKLDYEGLDDIEAMKMTSSIGPIGPPPTDEADFDLLDEVDVSGVIGELDDEVPEDSAVDEDDELHPPESDTNN